MSPTCRHTNKQIFPSCLTFFYCILDAFEKGKSSRTVKKSACCMEDYADCGKLYHMALKLSGMRRLGQYNNIKTKTKQASNFS